MRAHTEGLGAGVGSRHVDSEIALAYSLTTDGDPEIDGAVVVDEAELRIAASPSPFGDVIDWSEAERVGLHIGPFIVTSAGGYFDAPRSGVHHSSVIAGALGSGYDMASWEGTGEAQNGANGA